MAIMRTETDLGDLILVQIVETDDETGQMISTSMSEEWKPGTPEANRVATLATLDSLLPTLAAIKATGSGGLTAAQRDIAFARTLLLLDRIVRDRMDGTE